MRLLVLLYALTGATSLAYQIAWSRLIAREVGATLVATSAVVAWFLVGLALGALCFAGLADRVARPLRLYGYLEAGVAVYGLLSPLLAREILALTTGSPGSIILLVGLFLLPPTILMGGSFPAMLAAAAQRGKMAESIPALLYGANTAGAVSGVLLTAFVSLATLGLSRTLVVTALANLAVAVVAITTSSSAKDRRASVSTITQDTTAEANTKGRRARTTLSPNSGRALAVLCLSGFASLLNEIAWTRSLALVLGSSVYAFAIVLGAFLLGIGLGSLAYARRPPTASPMTDLVHLQLRAAVASSLFAALLTVAPGLLITSLRTGHTSPLSMALGAFGVAFVATVYATTAFGATFPAGIAELLKSAATGRACGLAFAVNTLGAVAGALLTSVVLIPRLGLATTLAVGVTVSLLAASVVAGNWRLRMYTTIGALFVLFALPAWWRWNQELLISGVYAYAYKYADTAGGSRRHGPATSKLHTPPYRVPSSLEPGLVFAGDGTHANIAVYRDSRDDLALLIDGKADASTALDGDMRTQLLLGHLPALFRPNAKRALVIGLGSGVTVSAVLQHPVDSVDILEIEPLVATVARTWFRTANRAALEDPRVSLTIGDGRRAVRNGRGRYDIITSEPSNLWMSGVSHLFTAEFFVQARAALTPNGVLCQWMHLYQVSADDVRMVLRGLRASFPNTALFLDGPDLLVIASDGSLARPYIDPASQRDLARVGIESPDDLDLLYVGDTAALDRFAGHGELHTDDRPLLEFTAPFSIARDDSFDIADQLIRAGQP